MSDPSGLPKVLTQGDRCKEAVDHPTPQSKEWQAGYKQAVKDCAEKARRWEGMPYSMDWMKLFEEPPR